MVEELVQEVRCLQSTVKNIQSAKVTNPSKPTETPVAQSGAITGGFKGAGGGRWECGFNRHLRHDCVPAGKLEGAGTAGQLPDPT